MIFDIFMRYAAGERNAIHFDAKYVGWRVSLRLQFIKR